MAKPTEIFDFRRNVYHLEIRISGWARALIAEGAGLSHKIHKDGFYYEILREPDNRGPRERVFV